MPRTWRLELLIVSRAYIELCVVEITHMKHPDRQERIRDLRRRSDG
jgi:hypothetical protein